MIALAITLTIEICSERLIRFCAALSSPRKSFDLTIIRRRPPGDTNIAWLNENGVRIWDEWATKEGDLGPIYGAQWTAWPGRDGKVINQIDDVIDCLKNRPDSRRILFNAWNVDYLPDEALSPHENVNAGRMALPPCNLLYQLYIPL